MAQLMTVRLRPTERLDILEAVYYRSKADGITFDIKDRAAETVYCQSVFSYDSLHQAREDARKTLVQIEQSRN